MKKRLLSLILAVCLLCGMVPICVSSQTQTQSESSEEITLTALDGTVNAGDPQQN